MTQQSKLNKYKRTPEMTKTNEAIRLHELYDRVYLDRRGIRRLVKDKVVSAQEALDTLREFGYGLNWSIEGWLKRKGAR